MLCREDGDGGWIRRTNEEGDGRMRWDYEEGRGGRRISKNDKEIE